MPDFLPWLIGLGPLTLAAVGLFPASFADRHLAATLQLARIASVSACVAAVGCGAAVLINGPLHTGLTGVSGIGFSLYLDVLSAAMLILVSFVGMSVVAYSRNYLQGDPRHGRFVARLSLTLAAVLLLIVSGNLFQFALAWTLISAGLHGLLVFYRERPAAVLAARKKFLASRLADGCLIAAMILLHRAFGSLEFTVMFAAADAMAAGDTPPFSMHAAAMLLVAAALLRSAQFPLHGWLLEVMETPTPVSALLHAGIINAGGFLVLRFANVIELSAPSLDVLAIVGGCTALFGSVVMLTQTSIKVSLAWSTIAQMGFMMLQCGLGLFSAALLHIVAHSLYKAHAFLSSGSIVDIARGSWSPSAGDQPHPARLLIAVACLLAMAFIVGAAAGVTVTQRPGMLALGAVLLLGLTQLIANSFDKRANASVTGRAAGLALVVAAAYFALQFMMEQALSGTLPPARPLRGALQAVIVTAVVVSFVALSVFQILLPTQWNKPRWRALYSHVTNGMYVNTVVNRWILRWWPGEPPAGPYAPRMPVRTTRGLP